MTSLLVRGMLVGLLAGLLGFGFARIFGEPQVDRAIAFEDQVRQAKGEAAEPELVSRPTQAGLGLFTGLVVCGVALGGLFSLVFAAASGRLGSLGARPTAAWLALAGFLVVIAVPALKYPPNPPAIGDPTTIGHRTGLYFFSITVSLAAAVVAIGLARRLSARLGAWNAILAAILGFLGTVSVALYLLPEVNELPARFSAALSPGIASLQTVLWATLGIAFGIAAETRFVGARRGTGRIGRRSARPIPLFRKKNRRKHDLLGFYFSPPLERHL
jgi:hypothetical protein